MEELLEQPKPKKKRTLRDIERLTDEQRRIVEDNFPLAYKALGKICPLIKPSNYIYHDLLSQCFSGLMIAVIDWTVDSKGYALSSFVYMRCFNRITRYFHDINSTRHKPLTGLIIRDSEVDELPQFKEKRGDVERYIDDPRLSVLDKACIKEALDICSRAIPKREWEILYAYHVTELSLSEIGKLHGGITKERVRQIINAATDKLFNRFDSESMI